MSLTAKVGDIRAKIAKARQNAPLAAPSVTLMAACKGQSATAIEEAIGLGVTMFGENRVQEAESKWPEIRKKHPHVALHLIGPLQTNKVEQALELFDVIQTLDRPKLALAIAGERESRIWNLENSRFEIPDSKFYIQINTGEEPQKAGVLPQEADDFIGYCLHELKLPVVGLMCIPPANQWPAPHFALLRETAQRHGLHELSMGMSEDFETAIRLGSTCVRIGRALFGERT